MLDKVNEKSGLVSQAEMATSFMSRILALSQQQLNRVFHVLFAQWDIGYVMMAFLLGRAMILNELSPFAIPFFAVMYHLKREKLLFIGLSILLGANLAVHNQSATIFAGMILFFFTQKILDLKGKTDLSYAPFLAFGSILIPQVLVHLYASTAQVYDYFMSGIESLLGFILTLIFVQAIPVLIYHRDQVSLEQEEIIALIILLASVMTGTLGWHVQSLSIEHIASRYFILLFALVGGGSIGASVGVVTGLILSLSNPNAIYQISLLAFSGLLAGLLKQANKLGISFGLILGTTILSIYLGNQDEIWLSFGESSVAILLFFLTPKVFIANIAKFIPGTAEFQNHYQEYVGKIRNITSNKIDQYAKMFTQLANSFQEISANPKIDETEQLDHFMSHISNTQCQTCFKKEKCWNEEFFKTYKAMTEVMTNIELKGKLAKKDIPADWVNHCVKYDKTTAELNRIYEEYGNDMYWKGQLEESRQLVAYQLFGVSKVMQDLAEEIKKEGMELSVQEKQIHQSLEQLGLSIRHVNVVNLDEGNVEIEVSQPSCNGRDECTKVIAPLISDVLDESIIVTNKDCQFGSDGSCKICMRSAKNYEIDTGFASAAKGGSWLSGDSFSTIEIGNGKYAVALSDGMGNGARAQTESKATLELLQQLLQSGIDETLAIKTINSVLLLRSQEEIFSTVDLAIIDLFSGFTKFLKVGSTPSFIKRGDEVIKISANNLPVGIIQDIDIDSVGQDLQPGDLLIMMTDGIYDSANAVNKDLWMKRMIQEITTDIPQEFSDLLLEKVIRNLQGDIVDDMTVVVSKIDMYKPEWATIKVPGMKRIERERMIN